VKRFLLLTESVHLHICRKDENRNRVRNKHQQYVERDQRRTTNTRVKRSLDRDAQDAESNPPQAFSRGEKASHSNRKRRNSRGRRENQFFGAESNPFGDDDADQKDTQLSINSRSRNKPFDGPEKNPFDDDTQDATSSNWWRRKRRSETNSKRNHRQVSGSGRRENPLDGAESIPFEDDISDTASTGTKANDGADRNPFEDDDVDSAIITSERSANSKEIIDGADRNPFEDDDEDNHQEYSSEKEERYFLRRRHVEL
jgi:hypothetical protein